MRKRVLRYIDRFLVSNAKTHLNQFAQSDIGVLQHAGCHDDVSPSVPCRHPGTLNRDFGNLPLDPQARKLAKREFFCQVIWKKQHGIPDFSVAADAEAIQGGLEAEGIAERHGWQS